MLKKTLCLILSSLTLFSTARGESDFITYEWLSQVATDTSYKDHIPHLRRLFNTMKVRGFIDCGCGLSTSYFLQNADRVISIEYINPGYGDKWYQECLTLFTDRTNWIPLTYNQDLRSNSFNNACAYQCSMHKDYALIDPTYLEELDTYFKGLIATAQLNGYDIDVAFINPQMYLRGDLVKLFIANNIPVVVAHNTSSDFGTKEKKCLYGWNKVVTPKNYMKIFIPYGQGTTFWVNKSHPEVIVSILEYRNAILQLNEIGENPDFQALTELADDL